MERDRLMIRIEVAKGRIRFIEDMLETFSDAPESIIDHLKEELDIEREDMERIQEQLELV